MLWRPCDAAVLLTLTSLASALSCDTNQNPYCAGNSKFEQICCPYPNVCYWADRAGTPACCPAGQSCQAAGGVITAPLPSTVDTTSVEPSTETESSYSTITSYVTHPPTTTEGGGVVVVTTTEPGVYQSDTSTIVGAYSTVTSDIAGGYSTVTSNVGGAYSTVTSNVAGAYSTVTTAVAAIATSVVEILNEADQTQPSNIALAVALAAAIWHFV